MFYFAQGDCGRLSSDVRSFSAIFVPLFSARIYKNYFALAVGSRDDCIVFTDANMTNWQIFKGCIVE